MILEIIGFIIFLIIVLAICGYVFDEDLSDWQSCCSLLLVLFFLVSYIAGNSLLRRIYIFTSILVLFVLNRRASRLSVKETYDYNSRERHNKNNNIPQNKPKPYNNRIEPKPNNNRIEPKPYNNRIEPKPNNRIEFEPNIEQDEEPISKPEETIEVKKEKIDINIATQEELSNLNALNLIQSKKIIQFRNNGRYIKSYDDLRDMLNLKDYQIKQIKDETFIDEKSIPHPQGRIVDL